MYRLWYMAQRSAAMDAVGMTWMAGSACASRATPARQKPISIDFLEDTELPKADITTHRTPDRGGGPSLAGGFR
jgi:hypothetical protein